MYEAVERRAKPSAMFDGTDKDDLRVWYPRAGCSSRGNRLATRWHRTARSTDFCQTRRSRKDSIALRQAATAYLRPATFVL